jgi:hypothetical protein
MSGSILSRFTDIAFILPVDLPRALLYRSRPGKRKTGIDR